MTKTILVTGSTDGIGLLTAKRFADEGHTVLLHGRSTEKLEAAATKIGGLTESYVADLSTMSEVIDMARAIRAKHDRLDVLINNAGVLKTPNETTAEGYDIRFMVNTFAPCVLTRELLSIIPKDGRIVNLSSAAQAPIDFGVMNGNAKTDAMSAYAQSKLAITIWTRELARELQGGPVVVAVNPGSLLASKMVQEGFGMEGNDIQIGVRILHEAALGSPFVDASGKYFDNDAGTFSQPHPAALDADHSRKVIQSVTDIVGRLS